MESFLDKHPVVTWLLGMMIIICMVLVIMLWDKVFPRSYENIWIPKDYHGPVGDVGDH